MKIHFLTTVFTYIHYYTKFKYNVRIFCIIRCNFVIDIFFKNFYLYVCYLYNYIHINISAIEILIND